MWWPWRRHRRTYPRIEEATARAEEQHAEAKRLRAEAEEVAEAHRRLRRNLRRHDELADAVARALRGMP